jgi:translation initiation factor 3 subunit K
MSTSADIRSLLDSRPGPSAVPQLQAHVAAQAKGETPYLFDAIRVLIKLYQLYPDSATTSDATTMSKTEAIALACLLALQQNMTDFLALVYMIPPNTMQAEPCSVIQACADALDACQYDQFWTQLQKLQSCDMPSVAALAKQCVSAFQSNILSTLALTYRQAPSAVVLKALQLDSLAGVTALQHSAVEFVSASDNVVTFKATADNTKREQVFHQAVGFSAITSLMSKLAQ